MAGWTRAAKREQLPDGGRLVVRVGGRQILLLRLGSAIHACNNRCPHEGYPLSEGTLGEDCSLTCNWHNWKFDLGSGDNLLEGDRLKIYPVELRGQHIWLDLQEPPLSERRAAIRASLHEAFRDNDYNRMAREISRLELTGVDLATVVADGIGWSCQHLQYGWTHAYAGAADWLVLYDEQKDPEAGLACILEALAHIADDVHREPELPYPGSCADYVEDRFVEAIEREDESAAIAMLRGALDQGVEFPDLQRGLSRAAFAHYQAFGHAAIYVGKAADLLQRLGSTVAEPLLTSLVRQIVYARREDLVPEFADYGPSVKRWGHGAAVPDHHSYQGLGIRKALAAAVAASGADPRDQYAALLGANATNMLGFDARQQDRVRISVSANIGWLDFSHGITFASAVRRQCERFPELWPAGLAQMACFSGRNAEFTVAEPDLDRWRVQDHDTFFKSAIAGLIDHDRDEFIESVHLLKTLLAARSEIRAGLPNEVAELLVAAINHLLSTPIRRKHVLRTVYQARKFVALDG